MNPIDPYNEMFARMSAETDWDVSGDLLWSFFFTDEAVARLEKLAGHLQGLGYRVVEIYQRDTGTEHVLHIERVATHSPETLLALNQEFEQIAIDFEIACFDGMDVGPVE